MILSMNLLEFTETLILDLNLTIAYQIAQFLEKASSIPQMASIALAKMGISWTLPAISAKLAPNTTLNAQNAQQLPALNAETPTLFFLEENASLRSWTASFLSITSQLNYLQETFALSACLDMLSKIPIAQLPPLFFFLMSVLLAMKQSIIVFSALQQQDAQTAQPFIIRTSSKTNAFVVSPTAMISLKSMETTVSTMFATAAWLASSGLRQKDHALNVLKKCLTQDVRTAFLKKFVVNAN